MKTFLCCTGIAMLLLVGITGAAVYFFPAALAMGAAALIAAAE